MAQLTARLSREIAEALERIGDFGEVTLKKRNGAVTHISDKREQMIVDERVQMSLREHE